MNDGVMNWWNRCSDEYYSGMSNQLGRQQKDPTWAFQTQHGLFRSQHEK